MTEIENHKIYLIPGQDFQIDSDNARAVLSDVGKGNVLKGMLQIGHIKEKILDLARVPELQELVCKSYFEEVTRSVNMQLDNPTSRQQIMDSIVARTASVTGEDKMNNLVVTITFVNPEPTKQQPPTTTVVEEPSQLVAGRNGKVTAV